MAICPLDPKATITRHRQYKNHKLWVTFQLWKIKQFLCFYFWKQVTWFFLTGILNLVANDSNHISTGVGAPLKIHKKWVEILITHNSIRIRKFKDIANCDIVLAKVLSNQHPVQTILDDHPKLTEFLPNLELSVHSKQIHKMKNWRKWNNWTHLTCSHNFTKQNF
jgi:hypothetical protein